MKYFLISFVFGLTAILSAQEIKNPKTELPPEGIATFRLKIKSIPTIRKN